MYFRRRLRAERRLSRLPPPRVAPLLSENLKTGTSINLPVLNCFPTTRCAAACYACVGPISWRNSLRKALALDDALKRNEVEGLIWECRRFIDVRLNGSGDLLPVHVPAVLRLAGSCPETVFWGFTRNREVSQEVNGRLPNLSLILTFDATSKDRDLSGYEGPLAFGPRRPGDEVPEDPRLVVVFPEHHVGHTLPGIPLHSLDCPATRGAKRRNACQRCRRCWRPFEAMNAGKEGGVDSPTGEAGTP